MDITLLCIIHNASWSIHVDIKLLCISFIMRDYSIMAKIKHPSFIT